MKLLAVVCLLLFVVGVAGAGSLSLSTSVIVKTKDGLTLYKPVLTTDGIMPTYDKNIFLSDTKKVESCISSDDKGTIGNAEAGTADITTLGDKAVFNSWATNLDGNIKGSGIFYKDIKSGDVRLLSDMGLGAAISEDGMWIAYEYSPDPDHVLPTMVLYEVATGKTTTIMETSGGNKAGWYMPDTRIEKGIVYFHSTISGKLQEYHYEVKR